MKSDAVLKVAVMTLILVVLFSSSSAFETDPTWSNLQFFGPILNDSNWSPRPMELVGNFTWKISKVPLDAGSAFLFVNKMSSGDLDWKSSKLGLGTSKTLVQIGGGNIFVQSRGVYNITVSTSSFILEIIPLYLWPSVEIKTTRSVEKQNPIRVQITFSKPTSDLSIDQVNVQNGVKLGFYRVASNASLNNSSDSDNSTGTNQYIVMINATSELVTVAIQEGVVKDLNSLPNTPAQWKLIFSPTETNAAWGRLFFLKDDSDRWKGKPIGGWIVTPIHGNLLPATGRVLITGWGRSEEFSCKSTGSRRMGVSFILDPKELTDTAKNPYYAQLIDEATDNPADVSYCSGHTTLNDGRVLYTGGATYVDLSTPSEKEFGLPYARIFDPITQTFKRIKQDMAFGSAWYPTNGRLEDGRVLISNGFSGFYCPGLPNCATPALMMFDPKKMDLGQNPWNLLVPANESTHDIDPGAKDYTRIWVLPQRVLAGNPPLLRQVGLMGGNGKTILFNTDDNTPNSQRFFYPKNGQRPICASDSTSAILSTGEIMSMGGCGGSMIDLYDPVKDSWRSFDTGIIRSTPSAVLLPDGTVLLLNGENGAIDQSKSGPQSQDPRYPQVFDPVSGRVITIHEQEPEDSPSFRGYHNMVTLLKDGRVLTGGGVHMKGDIGCEQPNFRIFSPPYLSKGVRPKFTAGTAEPLLVNPGGGQLVLIFNNGPLKGPQGGAALMAVTAFTHGYDHNQRYVPLSYSATEASQSSGRLVVTTPDIPVVIPGEYLLFLISAQGVPSEAMHVRVSEVPKSFASPVSPSLLWATLILCLICLFVH